MHRRMIALLAVASLLIAALPPTVTAASGSKGASQRFTQDGVYIVQLAELPVVAYDGSINGFAATRPGKGAKIDPDSGAVNRYVGHLVSRHDAELNGVGSGQKVYDYTYTFNGFAARLTASQANKLAADRDVVAVTPDEMHETDTSSTPDFLGLTATGGLWDQLGGVGSAGKDVIIGVVDSGIWPESLSFADRVDASGTPSTKGKKIYQNVPGWHGKCTPGENFTATSCNQKLIGARYYNAAFGGNAGIDAERPWEFNSARDYNGHGTHTSSTAGGNHGVPTTGPAAAFGAISGMAPRARIAMYKALWSTQDASTASGSTIDLVAAIDQAVADGVDVINYSISGTSTNFLDPVEISFLFAADAGIFVAESAGNSGPTASTVAHPGPWTTTVAAGTHNRNGLGSVTLGNDATYTGASVATAVGPAPLVDSVNVGTAGADPAEVELCFPGTLDPAVVTGKIVVCKRGAIARVDKSRAVLEAGGVGMVMYNDPDSSLNADFHFVPSVHVNKADGLAIKAYAAGGGATATINAATIVFNAPAPTTASFSSRGPLLAAEGDLLKPDVIAPGQDILAAVAPPGNAGRDFNLYSGTSMSSPHVAGLAALLRDLHPDWSPMAIKSALMTSAFDVLDGVSTASKIFRQGAGHVAPNSAADPGLVYDNGFLDWLAFLCGTTDGVRPSTCSALSGLGFSFDPSDMNVPSIAIGGLAGVQTVTRTVTNVDDVVATYTPTVSGLAGVDAVINPSSITLAPGESASFTVDFTTTSAALNAYVGGQLTWTDGTHDVRIPMIVRPVALSAPAEASGDGTPISYDVRFGYNGPFTATPRGLVAATTNDGTVADDPGDEFSRDGPGTTSFDIVVPAGTTYARFSLFDDAVDGADDLDLYVYRGDTLVGSSLGGTADEEVDFLNPVADTYTVWVHGFATDGPESNFTLFSWALDAADAGNMVVTAPPTATLGTTETIDLTFTGLTGGTRYLGSVAYGGTAGLPNPTIIRVDTPPAP